MATVLIVEDDKVFADLVRALLTRCEDGAFVPIHAASVAAARQMLAGQRVDVVVLDLNLLDSPGHGHRLRPGRGGPWRSRGGADRR